MQYRSPPRLGGYEIESKNSEVKAPKRFKKNHRFHVACTKAVLIGKAIKP